MKSYYSQETGFFGNTNPRELLNKYGSPLYVYNEVILRERCREIIDLVSYPKYRVNYSAKANSNLQLLKIIHEEGLHADAVSSGVIYILEKLASNRMKSCLRAIMYQERKWNLQSKRCNNQC